MNDDVQLDELPLPSRMNDFERTAGLVAAGIAVVMFIVVWGIVYGVGSKGLQYLGYGLLCALTLALGAVWRNRYVAAFAAVFIAGLRVPYAINLVFFVLSGWYVLRATKVARETAPARAAARKALRDERLAAKGKTPRQPRGRDRRNKEAAAESNRRTPTASKRYTPPKR